MAIEDRNLGAGTVLAGRYKGMRYECLVLESDGMKAYSLEDGTIHRSPSAAASKVMGGKAVNGWRFWSPAGEVEENSVQQAKAPGAAKPEGVATKTMKVIKHVPNQKGVAEGWKKWWCSACMKAFVVEGMETPAACPEGHAAEARDELSVT